MSALLLWWEHRFGALIGPPHGLWFRANGSIPSFMVWGPSFPDCNGWWIAPYDDVCEHLVSFTALTFPA